jgi:hypothetical protein
MRGIHAYPPAALWKMPVRTALLLHAGAFARVLESSYPYARCDSDPDHSPWRASYEGLVPGDGTHDSAIQFAVRLDHSLVDPAYQAQPTPEIAGGPKCEAAGIHKLSFTCSEYAHKCIKRTVSGPDRQVHGTTLLTGHLDPLSGHPTHHLVITGIDRSQAEVASYGGCLKSFALVDDCEAAARHEPGCLQVAS